MLPESVRRMITVLGRLPGVGGKTAQRFALYLVNHPQVATELAEEIGRVPDLVRPCDECGNIAELHQGRAICQICADSKREPHTLCVVARVQDLMAVERSGAVRGRYFVLGRLLSPLDGVGPEDLPLQQLIELVDKRQVQEVILATPPSVEGEATALLLARELNGRGVTTTRIASGIPHGGDLEYLDQITLGRAIDGRRALDSD